MAHQIARDFVAKVRGEDENSDIQVRYRVVGGMPSQRVKRDVTVSAQGVQIARQDARASERDGHLRLSVEQVDVRSILRAVAAGLPSLTPAAEARSLPDGLVGELTVFVDGAEETFHFVPEQEQRRITRPVSPVMEDVLGDLWRLSVGDVGKEPNRA